MKCLALLFALIASLVLAQASSPLQQQLEQEIKNYQDLLKAREQEIAANEAALGETAAAISARIVERDQLSHELGALRSERKQLMAEIESLHEELALTAKHMVDLQTELDSLKERVRLLLLDLYKQRGGRFARVLGQAESYHDLQVKSKYLSILSNRDIRLIDDLSLATDVLAGLQQEQAEQLASLNQKSEALAATEIALAAREADLKQIISELESSRAGQLAVRTSLLKEQEAIEANIGRASASLASEQARLQREAEEKRRQAAAASSETQRQALTQDAQRLEARLAALGAPLPPLSGSYSYPFANPTLVSRFGEDQATFVALRADAAGAAVHAMQSGVVISVQNMGANFGHMVMVKHSEDVTLAYLNLQDSLLVESGQSLSQGDILGYLGGSTLTPQNVLKLYAYRNDSFVDPLKVIGF